mmetsp:Transcript_14188/g.19699  ORF Transcript_14188/g.19699 Transcript_14188/m.19699 type:complete len:466 (+) Transcript_14188:204-1601(+)|eukprot:CAMPEP_0184478506 /NCGR_PEP_ID=MMETSP0113_2-20130426/511_1 /TAXON_ID=91329 /ORGANISM="Norrisiella sphaerica, Strain BC52" /LENGTH=465 /DNA_ID=CAMNT_0026856319 /DNA_START=204 /DNA_END=1601 /DNA_ORIENTATION=+
MSYQQRETGTIKKFFIDKGYGFIGRHTICEDVFFHIKELKDKARVGFPELGMEVEYNVALGHEGRTCAKEIVVISGCEGRDAKRMQRPLHDSKRGALLGNSTRAGDHEVRGRSRGVVKSVRGTYGFIVETVSQRKIFFRKRDVTYKNPGEGVTLRVGERVDFVMNEENVIGIVATDIRPYMVQGEILSRDEDRRTEYKSLANSNAPERRIGITCNKYVCAFLNSKGGEIFFGIEDDGKVSGILLNKYQRDTARKDLDYYLNGFNPPVDPDRYSIAFLKVYQNFCGDDLMEMTDRYVVRVHVRGPSEKENSCTYYQDSKGAAWIRMDGSVTRMSHRLFEERRSKFDNSKLEKRIALLQAEMNAMRSQTNKATPEDRKSSVSNSVCTGKTSSSTHANNSINPAASAVANLGEFKNSGRPPSAEHEDKATIDAAVGLGYDRSAVLEIVKKIRDNGKVPTLNSTLDMLG